MRAFLRAPSQVGSLQAQVRVLAPKVRAWPSQLSTKFDLARLGKAGQLLKAPFRTGRKRHFLFAAFVLTIGAMIAISLGGKALWDQYSQPRLAVAPATSGPDTTQYEALFNATDDPASTTTTTTSTTTQVPSSPPLTSTTSRTPSAASPATSPATIYVLRSVPSTVLVTPAPTPSTDVQAIKPERSPGHGGGRVQIGTPCVIFADGTSSGCNTAPSSGQSQQQDQQSSD